MCPIFLSTTTPHHSIILSTANDEENTYTHSESFPAINVVSLSPPGSTDNCVVEKHQSTIHTGLNTTLVARLALLRLQALTLLLPQISNYK